MSPQLLPKSPLKRQFFPDGLQPVFAHSAQQRLIPPIVRLQRRVGNERPETIPAQRLDRQGRVTGLQPMLTVFVKDLDFYFACPIFKT